MTDATQERIIALDVRPQSFGYVVLEGPEHLLDWGVRSFRNGVNAVQVPARQKLAKLLDEVEPSAVLVREPLKGRQSSKLAKMLDAVRQEAKSRRITVRCVSRAAIRNAFGGQNRITKYQIASMLSVHFPALSWKLPPKRKCWESEDYRMSIFEAAALGVAYFGPMRGPVSIPPSSQSSNTNLSDGSSPQ